MSRRAFVNMLIAAATAPLILWWIFVGKRDLKLSVKDESVNIGTEVPEGINFHDDIIVVREKDIIRAYEAKCTHLGCRISKSEGNELVCPCHGSRFGLDGNSVSGPAQNPLKAFIVTIDPASGDIIIKKNHD